MISIPKGYLLYFPIDAVPDGWCSVECPDDWPTELAEFTDEERLEILSKYTLAVKD